MCWLLFSVKNSIYKRPLRLGYFGVSVQITFENFFHLCFYSDLCLFKLNNILAEYILTLSLFHCLCSVQFRFVQLHYGTRVGEILPFWQHFKKSLAIFEVILSIYQNLLPTLTLANFHCMQMDKLLCSFMFWFSFFPSLIFSLSYNVSRVYLSSFCSFSPNQPEESFQVQGHEQKQSEQLQQ